mmetsp:Transcript_73471/g.232048  ORF Transcript_73471/g.232048 Transcript_73471/m.232048 type:complete len:234 (+) Transcript_73471:485-1186(+)
MDQHHLREQEGGHEGHKAEDQEEDDLREIQGVWQPGEAPPGVRQRHDAGDQLRQRARQSNDAGQVRVDPKEEEELVVVKSHAVVYPGAVVVHAHDAYLADQAVVGPLWSRRQALLAEGRFGGLPLGSCRDHLQRHTSGPDPLEPTIWYDAGVAEVRHGVAPYAQEPGEVEDDEERDHHDALAHSRHYPPKEDHVVDNRLINEGRQGHAHQASRNAGREARMLPVRPLVLRDEL